MASLQKRNQEDLLPPGVSLADVTQFLEKNSRLDSAILRRRRAIMEMLLDSACPLLHRPKGAFASLWTEEANHRAINILQLLLWSQSVSRGDGRALDGEEQHAQAVQLAAEFVTLRKRSDQQTLLCAGILTNMIEAIFKVFKPSQYPLKLCMSVGDTRLSACKLQALVLICTELSFNALKLGFIQQSPGHVRVALNCVENNCVLVAFEINILNADRVVSKSSYRLILKLSSVLSAETLYRVTKSGGGRLEILFPLDC